MEGGRPRPPLNCSTAPFRLSQAEPTARWKRREVGESVDSKLVNRRSGDGTFAFSHDFGQRDDVHDAVRFARDERPCKLFGQLQLAELAAYIEAQPQDCVRAAILSADLLKLIPRRHRIAYLQEAGGGLYVELVGWGKRCADLLHAFCMWPKQWPRRAIFFSPTEETHISRSYMAFDSLPFSALLPKKPIYGVTIEDAVAAAKARFIELFRVVNRSIHALEIANQKCPTFHNVQR